MITKNFEKGISLYLSLVIMAILLSLALGINSILLSQIKTMQEIGNSVSAFAAAETGIERELYENNTTTVSYSGYLDLNRNSVQDNLDSSYNVQIIAPNSGGCPAGINYCVKSVGTYKSTKRAIYITR